jgi:hypothetical protein
LADKRADQMGIRGFTSTEASRPTGFHAPRLMVLLTEARDVEPPAWEGAFANATGAESRIVAMGKPDPALQPTDNFLQVSRSPNWTAVKIGAREHPNVVEGREVIPGAVTQDFIDLMAEQYGAGSGTYRARVEGEFPDKAYEALVHRSWVLAANDRWRALRGDGRFRIASGAGHWRFALDPARFGPDSSVLAVRSGDVLEELVSWSRLDTVETAWRVLAQMERFGIVWPVKMHTLTIPCGPPHSQASYTLTVDEPGLGGGVLDKLKELGVRVIPLQWRPHPIKAGGRHPVSGYPGPRPLELGTPTRERHDRAAA